MQVTLYYSDEDQYVIDLVDQLALRERKSRSAVVLSILEEYFERGKRIGEILVDLGFVEPRDLDSALKAQQKDKQGRQLGEILVEKGLVSREDIVRALTIQDRFRSRNGD